MPISFTDNERKEFQLALKELVKEVNECIKRNNRTKRNQLSAKDTNSSIIKQHLSFLDKYKLECKVGLGNAGGVMNPHSWIMFVRKDLLDDELINSSKITPQKGIYPFFEYGGYFDDKIYFKVQFGFPESNIENARCKAVDEMERSGKLTELDFTYDKLELEQITDDFIKLLEYYESFSKYDFIPANQTQTNSQEKLFSSWLNDKVKSNTAYQYIRSIKNWFKDNGFKNYKSFFDIKTTKELEEYVLTFASLDFKTKSEDFDEYMKKQGCLDCQSCIKKYFEFIGGNVLQVNNKNIPLNQILYGAPGVGKTYNTINIALEILGEDFSNYSDKTLKRKAMQEKFKEYLEKEQIVFTTFHQSYGYEEFVEGIRPDFDNDELKYKIENGIFKDLCIRATNISQELNNEGNLFDNTTKIWKISLGAKYRPDTQALQDFCFSNNQIRIGWGDTGQINTEPSINSFRKMKIGDLVCVLKSKTSIKAVGVIKSGVMYDNSIKNGFDGKEYQTYREVEWISKKNVDIFKLNKNKNLVQQTVYSLNRFKPKDLFQLIGIDKEILTIENNEEKPYIIIIDEINRGNISKIFGELITLIEPSKRLGNAEELEVVLPYSKERFSVPNNVYIIGTMNTADRSITTLDTALRRRFEFKKIMPTSSLLNANCDGVNLQELLNKMNERIECLIGDEKLIGHSYFMDINSIDELKAVFSKKILPLLEEYFYNDYSQIKSVLNDNGMIKTKNILNTDTLYLSDDFSEVDFKKIYED